MNEKLPSDILRNARQLKVDWLIVAEAFEALSQKPRFLPPGVTPIQWAASVSGYSANHLRRMTAARQFLLELQANAPAVARRLDRPKFSHLEVLAKIWRIDADRVLQLLERERKLGYTALTETLKSLQTTTASTSQSLVKRSHAEFRSHCISLLIKEPRALYLGRGDYTWLLPGHSPDPYCKPDMVVRFQPDDSYRRWAGVDFLQISDARTQSIQRKIIALATECTFLEAMWLCVPGMFDVAKEIGDQLDFLHLINIGLLVDEGHSIHTLRRPARIGQEPDRRDLYRAPKLTTTVFTGVLL